MDEAEKAAWAELSPVIDAVEMLKGNLRVLKADFSQFGVRSNATTERVHAIAALQEVLDFLNCFEDLKAERVAAPLTDLWAALIELHKTDTVLPIIAAPPRSGGRTKRSWHRKALEGIAAGFVDHLMDPPTSLRLEDAATFVANELNAAGYRIHDKTTDNKMIDKKSLLSWRKRAKEGNPSEDNETIRYRSILEQLKRHSLLDRKAGIRRAIHGLVSGSLPPWMIEK